MLTAEQKSFFAQNGYLTVPALVDAGKLAACRARIEQIIAGRDKRHMFVRYGAGGRPVFYRVPQLAQHDKEYDDLARQPNIWEAVQDLIGPAELFRDILVAKPPKEGHSVVYHQDAAYWDVKDSSRSLSAWIALDDAPLEAGCLQFVPGSHRRPVQHEIYFRGHKLPESVKNLLRGAVSLTGTGDNPQTRVERLFWRLKDLVIGKASKLIPSINDLNWLRADPKVAPGEETLAPAKAGDVIFFHGLLLHASGPNTSPNPRRAYIATYAGL
jgi:ectoine hydroxylase-related dioxygenase (phytanoyl-CoA dioxygenase family)